MCAKVKGYDILISILFLIYCKSIVYVFKNPTKDCITINLGVLTEKEYQFQLIDIQGKKVLEKLITNPNQLEKIDISHFAKGIYLANLNAGDKKISKKIVIE